jgi:hypothetical protein
MKSLTEAEVRQWFDKWHAETGIEVESEYPSLYYNNPKANILIFPYPETPLEATYHAQLVNAIGLTDKQDFEGALFWLTSWDLGPTSPVGWRLLERIRAGLGDTRSLELAPGQSFRRDELSDLSVFALTTFNFGWSAFIIPFWPTGHFVYIDHKDRWCIVSRTTETHEAIARNLTSLAIKPCDDDVFKWGERFCRNAG